VIFLTIISASTKNKTTKAIFLGREYEFSDYGRESFIYTKDEILANRPKEKTFKKIIRKVRRFI